MCLKALLIQNETNEILWHRVSSPSTHGPPAGTITTKSLKI